MDFNESKHHSSTYKSQIRIKHENTEWQSHIRLAIFLQNRYWDSFQCLEIVRKLRLGTGVHTRGLWGGSELWSIFSWMMMEIKCWMVEADVVIQQKSALLDRNKMESMTQIWREQVLTTRCILLSEWVRSFLQTIP